MCLRMTFEPKETKRAESLLVWSHVVGSSTLCECVCLQPGKTVADHHNIQSLPYQCLV